MPKVVARTYAIARAVLNDAYYRNAESFQFPRDTLRKVRELAVELRMVTPLSKAVWKTFGIWDEPPRPSEVPS